jgi:hypothetical protein
MQSIDASFDYVWRSIEIRLSDLQVDNALPPTLQRPRFVQHFEGCFGTEPGHAAGKL